MWTLTVKSRGRITLPKDLLQHLGVGPGDEIEFELLPDGQGALMRGKPSKRKNALLILPAGRTHMAATINEINEEAARGWMDEKRRTHAKLKSRP